MENEYIISKELVVDGLYNLPLDISNGNKQRLITINRSCLYNKIYIKVKFTGRAYINLYRGYQGLNGVKYGILSNHQLVTGTGEEQYIEFRDYTFQKENFIYYFFEIEAVDDISIKIEEMGVIFNDFLASSDHSSKYDSNFQTDINQFPLTEQFYDKYIQLNHVINKGQLQEFINVVERPYKYYYNSGCLEIETKQLGMVGSPTSSYVASSTQWLRLTTNNIEDI